jgi:hypothetical protein
MDFLENGLGSYYPDTYHQPIKMLTTMFMPSIESSSVKELMGHMLRNMNFDKYQQFLERTGSYPELDHRFVVLEYVESPCDVLIKRSEQLAGSRMSVHNVIQNPDFDLNMKRLFGNSDRNSWYTRRKRDYTKPFGSKEALTDTRQLVVLVKREQEDEMPPLVSNLNADVPRPVLNPEPEDEMPPLIPIAMPPLTWTPSHGYIGSSLNQTIWSPFMNSYNYLTPS